MPNSNGSNDKKTWYTLSIIYSINPRDNFSGKAPKGDPPLEFINIQPPKGGPSLEFR
jgi:hypothetical protein